MTSYLVGSTGFVGSNIEMSTNFDGLFHSTNIEAAFGGHPDLLVFAGLPAEKFLANTNPAQDKAKVEEAFSNIKKIGPKQLVLISTIDVYEKPYCVDENTKIEVQNLSPYGKNRFWLEHKVREEFSDILIVRLPALYGKHIKKNFLFDILHPVPSLLSNKKFDELFHKNSKLKEYYSYQENEFWKCNLSLEERNKVLKPIFEKLGFNSLYFTDSRARFQFYPLRFLWSHIQTALENHIALLNLATEPIQVSEIYKKATGKEFNNQLPNSIPNYDFRSIYASLFSGKENYIFEKNWILEDILSFLKIEGEIE